MDESDAAAPRTGRVGRLEFAVDWPPGHVAAYLLDGPEPVLFDAGTPGDDGRADLRAGLAALDCDPAAVDHLVVTHPHVDHLGQVPAVLDAADPTVYAPAGVRERLARDADDLAAAVRANAVAAGLPDAMRAEMVEMAVDSLARNRDLLPPEAVDVWVTGGDTVAVGDREFDVVHAPGHQADHCCFAGRAGGESVLFAGDMAIATFRSVALHDGLAGGVGDAVPAFSRALDRLAAVDADRVYPGHGPVHDDLDAALADSRRSLDRLLDRTAGLVADGATTAYEVAARRADGDRDVRYALFETVSALRHLDGDRVVASTGDDGVRRYEPA